MFKSSRNLTKVNLNYFDQMKRIIIVLILKETLLSLKAPLLIQESIQEIIQYLNSRKGLSQYLEVNIINTF